MLNYKFKRPFSALFLLVLILCAAAQIRPQTPGDLDTSFNGTGKKIDGFGGAIDRIYGVAIQTDGKIVAAGQTYQGSRSLFALVRYNSDGSRDTSFGENGKVQIAFGTAATATAYAVALQPDGKIVAAGEAENSFALARLNADGSLDTTFDADGKVMTDFYAGNADRVYAVVLQPDGKIVAAGQAYTGLRTQYALARYQPDGSLDTSFDTDGKLAVDYSTNDSGAYGAIIQPDGKIVVCGSSSGRISVIRYNSNGSLDTTFGADGNGRVRLNPANGSARGLVIQPDGKIVVAGTGRQATTYNDVIVARLNVNGTLDTAFDADGIASTPLGTNSSAVNAVTVQTDGKIVVAGYPFSAIDFVCVRFNSSGTLDTTFNGTGIVTTPIGSANDTPQAIAVQTDGKIVVAGSIIISGTTVDMALVRYNSDGTLDPSFDFDGIETDDLNNNAIVSVGKTAVQLNGKIVVAGAVNGNFAVARYNSDGTADTSFNGTGKVLTDIGPSTDLANAVAVQTDGKIVAAGGTVVSNNARLAVVRYNPNGSLDTSFDTDGIATILTYNYSIAYTVAVQPDGKILVAGAVESSLVTDSILARFNPNGSLDTTFNGSGIVIYNFGGSGASNESIRDVKIQTDGKIVAAVQAGPTGGFDFVTARFNTNGSLDTSFDADGIAVTPVGLSNDLVYSLALQPDGKIVAAGAALNSLSRYNYALVRYNANGSLDTTFNTSGIVTTAIGTGNDEAFAAVIQADGKIIAAGRTQNGTLSDLALVRYNTDGTLDSNLTSKTNDSLYGNGGKVIVDLGDSETVNGLALDSGGRAVVVGQTDGLLGLARIHGSLAPTAATAEIAGRVTDSAGNNLARVRVTLQNTQTGETSTVMTNNFGRFNFANLAVENLYVLSADGGKRYVFKQNTQIVRLSENVADLSFVAAP